MTVTPEIAALDLWFQRAARLMFRHFESGKVRQYQIAYGVEDGPTSPFPREEEECTSP